MGTNLNGLPVAPVGSDADAPQSTGAFVLRDARGERRLRIIGEFRGKLAVRNIQTGRLSYVRPTDPRIVRHRLRWQPARFGKTSAHCSCGAECRDDTPERIQAWFSEHIQEV